jgi:hypothetical protein
MILLPTIEEKWREFERKAIEARDDRGGGDAFDNESTYTARTEIPGTPPKGLVRLDNVVLACHIIAARYTFHGLATIRARLVSKAKTAIISWLGKAAAKKVLGQIPGRATIANLVSTIAGVIADTPAQIELENAVRVASFEVRSDLYREQMKVNPRRIRKTKLVYSRHAPKKKHRRLLG